MAPEALASGKMTEVLNKLAYWSCRDILYILLMLDDVFNRLTDFTFIDLFCYFCLLVFTSNSLTIILPFSDFFSRS